MILRKCLGLWLLLLMLCVGCAAAQYSDMRMEADALEAYAPAALRAETGAPASPTLAALPAADQPAPATAQAGQRIVIYSGMMQLVVSDVARTLEVIRAEAITMGGYLQEMDSSSVTVRVPVQRFQEVVSWVARLGEVTQRQIRSQDVTEEMRDLGIRLDNAEQTRRRLLGLLEKSTKMEDTLKIEAELERVTQTIELLKGKIQSLSSQVAFSTLKVLLNSPLPQRQIVAQIPFAWVRRLGEGVVSGAAAQDAQTSWKDRRAIRFDPPKSYIRYFDCEETTEAMSAEGVLIKIQKHNNYKGGDLDFWSALVRRSLVESRAVAFSREETIKLEDKTPARLLAGTRDIAGQKSGYLIVIVVTEKRVYAFEAWGPVAAFEKDREAIEASVRSLEPR